MEDTAYRTGDLVLASVLWLEGFRPELELDRSRVKFVFQGSEASEEIVRIAGEVAGCTYMVEPLEFTRAMSEIKVRMYRFLEVSGIRPRTSAA